MAIDATSPRDLRTLIGRRCVHQGAVWRLIDVLPDEGLLILEDQDPRPPIQVDQYGRASHRANAIREIPIRGDHPSGLSDTLVELLDGLDQAVARSGDVRETPSPARPNPTIRP
jgi:hypothetical protein